MRALKILMLALMLVCSLPLLAQEDTPPKEEKKEEEKKDDTKDDAKEGQREMSAEGKSLYVDVELVFKKYYALVFEKVKANEQYKAEDVWNEAVKEAANAKYKDSEEFHKAVTAMKRKDRVFKKDMLDLTTRLAKENAEAIEKWTKEQK